MDGNGRWANARGLPRNEGHAEGLRRAKELILHCANLGIPFLSLYVFSTENWRRTEREVSFLMGLLRQSLKKEMKFYEENSIRVLHSGDISALPPDIQKDISEVGETTKNNTKLTVNLLINYGGRDEILRAAKKWHLSGAPPNSDICAFLDHPELPDLDLVIRTAGEKRLSNFMLWKAAYAEFCFSDRCWPDFTTLEFDKSIKEYSERIRNFGGGGE